MKTEIMLAARDVEASSAWYQQLFGWKSNHGGPYFDQLVNDAGQLMLMLCHWGTEHHPTMRDPSAGPIGHGLVFYIQVDDIEVIYDRAQKMGTTIEEELHFFDLAYHHEFSLRDPDGWWLTVCGPQQEPTHD